jgi:hypothetical protein
MSGWWCERLGRAGLGAKAVLFFPVEGSQLGTVLLGLLPKQNPNSPLRLPLSPCVFSDNNPIYVSALQQCTQGKIGLRLDCWGSSRAHPFLFKGLSLGTR